jgi:hypothetical protein
MRATLPPAPAAFPTMTSSTSAGSIPAASTTSASTADSRPVMSTVPRTPPARPTGVRLAATITGSRSSGPSVTDPRHYSPGTTCGPPGARRLWEGDHAGSRAVLHRLSTTCREYGSGWTKALGRPVRREPRPCCKLSWPSNSMPTSISPLPGTAAGSARSIGPTRRVAAGFVSCEPGSTFELKLEHTFYQNGHLGCPLVCYTVPETITTISGNVHALDPTRRRRLHSMG